MAQLQITLDEQLLHQLFLGDSKESGINALGGDFESSSGGTGQRTAESRKI